MSKNEEEVRKELEKKHAEEERLKEEAKVKAEEDVKARADAEAEAKAQERLSQKMKSASGAPPAEKKEEKKEENPFSTAYSLVKDNLKPEDVKALNNDFDEKFPGKRTGNLMRFNSREEAKTFFEDQADKGRSFLVKEQGADHYMYSDGKGDFFAGTEAELKAHMDKKAGKDYSQAEAPKPEANDETKKAETPTPLSTTPKSEGSTDDKKEDESIDDDEKPRGP